MSIWDNMNRKEQPGNSQEAQGKTFTIQFSTETVEVKCGPDMSLSRALQEHAAMLGYDGSRAVTWRNLRGVVTANTIGEPTTTYTASVALETKGL